MPKAEKIRRIKAGKKVRPPKRWWKKMYRRVSKQYPTYGKKRKSKIAAGIWHKMKKSSKLRVVSKYG
jgi:hypothetical protein